MNRKVPKVFANTIDKKLTNNTNVYYSSKNNSSSNINNKSNKKKNYENLDKVSINKKIHDIFNSPRYVYKADVNITLDSGVITKRIVGRNSNELITIDNELIPIQNIRNIEFSE